MLLNTIITKFNHFIKVVTTYIAVEATFTDLSYFKYLISSSTLLLIFSIFI